MDRSTGDKNPGYASGRGYLLVHGTVWCAELVRNLPQGSVTVTVTGAADGGQDAAPGGDKAFLLAGVEEHELGMGDPADHGQDHRGLRICGHGTCVSVGKVPANPWAR